jgi:hypothetical protein
MAFSAESVKRRSPGLWPILLAASSVALGGCIIVEEDHHDDGWTEETYVPPPSAEEAMLMTIDTDATVTAEPGEGVGIFVEYAAGGTWRIWTTCDTNHSNAPCYFDIFASVDTSSELLDIFSDESESGDQVRLYSEGTAYFGATTESDVDAMVLNTTPGAIVRLEVYLDGVEQPRFLYWFGDGVLHRGAPTHPIDLEPSEQ